MNFSASLVSLVSAGAFCATEAAGRARRAVRARGRRLSRIIRVQPPEVADHELSRDEIARPRLAIGYTIDRQDVHDNRAGRAPTTPRAARLQGATGRLPQRLQS